MAGKSGKAEPATGSRTVATNRRARFEYFILETFQAGIMLTGTEIKSVRAHKVTLVRGQEAFLHNVNIAQYEHGNRNNHEEARVRKLLLHKKEIAELHAAATQKGNTLIPLRMYINERGLAKVEIAIVKGKQLHDKRNTIAERDSERDMRRVLKGDY
jgi:SsrA-binding protein